MKKYLLIFIASGSISVMDAQQNAVGIFESHADVGNVRHRGNVVYNSIKQEYQVSGSGANIWSKQDEFHFAWKKMKGDFILRTHAAFTGKGTDPHRKTGWMVRSSLDTGSAHVSAVVHGDGLSSLQFRRKKGLETEEKKSTITGPDVIQLERKGNRYIMSVAKEGELFTSEEIDSILLGDDVFVGIFVCSHNKDVIEKVNFYNTRIVVPTGQGFVAYRDYLGSMLEILDIQTAKSRIIYQSPRSLQAPNWTLDGGSLIYNSNGLLYRYNLKNNTPSVIPSGYATSNNNDHVISFDGKMLAISHHSKDDNNSSIIYTLPIGGGEPKRVTAKGPSYLHGWSPDGKYLTYTAQRNNDYNIYIIPSSGGEEIQLTTAPGLDDGPEYSPDGKYIYFNSVRSGTMQLWRMKPDGSEQQQLTNDELNNWFPHISPDGKWIVYLTFGKDVSPSDHPFYKHVYLRLMPTSGGASRVVAYLYGGQGTINTPSWSPDSKKVAFISNSNLLYKVFPVEVK